MASIRSSSIVSLTPAGDLAWREQTLPPRQRDLLALLRSAQDQELSVRELLQGIDAGARESLGPDLGGLARNGWVVIPELRPPAPVAPAEEAPPASGSEALSELLTRRPPPMPTSIEVPIEAVPAPGAAPVVEGTLPKSPVDVHSDEERDRRMLEAMGIIAGPKTSAPAPAPRTEDGRREKLSASGLMERIRQKGQET